MKCKRSRIATLLLLVHLLLASCAYRVTLHARDGEKLDGQWRFGYEGGALLELSASDGEVLVGALEALGRRNFFQRYQETFGHGSIDADGPDLSVYGNGLWGPLGRSNALLDMVHGESFNPAAMRSHNVIRGPLLYWTADLQGDRQTSMHCFLIGSAHTARGLGRCKSGDGKEYTVEF
jgi:hypothetical protein